MVLRLARHLLDTFWHGDLRMARAAVAIGSLCWAFDLLRWDHFHRPAYIYLRELMPEDAWGLSFLAVGTIQLFRAITGVPVSSGTSACIAGGMSCALWCYVAAALHLSLTPPPAINAGNIVIALLSCVILVRAIARRD
jgi:hypothetical protein